MLSISKKEVLNTIHKMPEQIDIEDLMYRLYVIEKVNSGRESLKNGTSKTADELLEEIETW
jgi:hypothetical protein